MQEKIVSYEFLKKGVCPWCGSQNVKKTPVELTIFHRFLCRDCLTQWDDSPFDNVNYKPVTPVRIKKSQLGGV